MVSAVTRKEIVTDAWLKTSWEEFITLTQDPTYANGKFYYDQGCIRIEMTPIGPIHSRDNSVVSKVISLFAAIKRIQIIEFTNCSFRKTGERESQPDISCYIGSELRLPPRNDSPVDLDRFDPPTLVIEIASTTLSDDLGQKRLLYERLGVREYWVVDAKAGVVIALAIANGHSGQIQVSQVLPDLQISVVEEALHRSQTQDDGEIMRWLLQIGSGA